MFLRESAFEALHPEAIQIGLAGPGHPFLSVVNKKRKGRWGSLAAARDLPLPDIFSRLFQNLSDELVGGRVSGVVSLRRMSVARGAEKSQTDHMPLPCSAAGNMATWKHSRNLSWKKLIKNASNKCRRRVDRAR